MPSSHLWQAEDLPDTLFRGNSGRSESSALDFFAATGQGSDENLED
jgi:hypothetical protein